MNIRLHIDRVVLDSALPAVDRALLVRAVEGELARLLVESPLASDLAGGGSVPQVRGRDVLEHAADAEGLGRQIAAAVHAGLTGEGRGAP